MKMCGAFEHLGPGQRERKEDGVARGHVGHRDAAAHLRGRSRLRHVDLAGEGRAAESIQADFGHQVPLRAQRGRHARGGLQLDLVPLPVIEREGVAGVPFAARQRQASGRIEASAEEANGFVWGSGHSESSIIVAARANPLPHLHSARHPARQRHLRGDPRAGPRARATRPLAWSIETPQDRAAGLHSAAAALQSPAAALARIRPHRGFRYGRLPHRRTRRGTSLRSRA